MTGKVAPFLLSIVIVGTVMVAGACGSSSDKSTPVPGTATPAIVDTASREMLQAMIPDATDLPGFTLSQSGFLDNEQASAQATDPAAQLTRLNEMGRIVGFHAIFVPSADAPAGGPTTILWSVNLFQEPAGALEFIKETPGAPEGVTLEPLDVSGLSPNAVGYAVRSSDTTKPGSGYGVALQEGTVEVSVTATYSVTESSPDYTLSLAQQALTLVETGMGSESAPHAPQAPLEGIPAAATPAGGVIQVPMRAVVGTLEP